jgi:hypothetical protein
MADDTQQPPQPQQTQHNAGPATEQSVYRALETFLNAHEVQVLALMGLLMGYICIFFTKILNFSQMYVGVLGIIAITFLFLTLVGPDWRSRHWWLRTLAVIVVALIVTSPQLYFAWTVSVTEAQLAAQAQKVRLIDSANQFVQPRITVTNP